MEDGRLWGSIALIIVELQQMRFANSQPSESRDISRCHLDIFATSRFSDGELGYKETLGTLAIIPSSKSNLISQLISLFLSLLTAKHYKVEKELRTAMFSVSQCTLYEAS